MNLSMFHLTKALIYLRTTTLFYCGTATPQYYLTVFFVNFITVSRNPFNCSTTALQHYLTF
jgi:hypothetical protein